MCPKCRKRVSTKQPHSFHKNQRYHRECLEEHLEEIRLQTIDTTIAMGKKHSFLEMWNRGMKYHNRGSPQWQLRYCPKQRKSVAFSELKGLECWKCDEYIVNDGNCDCI